MPLTGHGAAFGKEIRVVQCYRCKECIIGRLNGSVMGIERETLSANIQPQVILAKSCSDVFVRIQWPFFGRLMRRNPRKARSGDIIREMRNRVQRLKALLAEAKREQQQTDSRRHRHSVSGESHRSRSRELNRSTSRDSHHSSTHHLHHHHHTSHWFYFVLYCSFVSCHSWFYIVIITTVFLDYRFYHWYSFWDSLGVQTEWEDRYQIRQQILEYYCRLMGFILSRWNCVIPLDTKRFTAKRMCRNEVNLWVVELPLELRQIGCFWLM